MPKKKSTRSEAQKKRTKEGVSAAQERVDKAYKKHWGETRRGRKR